MELDLVSVLSLFRGWECSAFLSCALFVLQLGTRCRPRAPTGLDDLAAFLCRGSLFLLGADIIRFRFLSLILALGGNGRASSARSTSRLVDQSRMDRMDLSRAHKTNVDYGLLVLPDFRGREGGGDSRSRIDGSATRRHCPHSGGSAGHRICTTGWGTP